MFLDYIKVKKVKEPEIVLQKFLKIYVPDDIGELICQPLCDIIIPTGLIFSGIFKKGYDIKIHLESCISMESDILGCISEEQLIKNKSDLRCNIKFPILTGNNSEFLIHLINLDIQDLIMKPGDILCYLEFIKLETITVG